MIQPHELRIGNMVGTFDSDYTDEPTIHFVNKVTSISAKGCELDSRSFCAYDELLPIPLTEEWLMKAGFVVDADRGNFLSIDLGNDTILFEDLGCDRMYIRQYMDGDFDCMSIPKDITFLHQLQNLYYCLCGEELKIEI